MDFFTKTKKKKKKKVKKERYLDLAKLRYAHIL